MALVCDTLELFLLSDWKAEIGPVQIDLRGQKRRALLTYLTLLDGRPSHRDDLAELFWPAVDLRKARASLRQALTDLRKALGADLIKSDGELVSMSRARATTDVADLARDLRASHSGAHVETALRGMAGLLRAFDGIGPALDDWLQDTRARLTDLVFDAASVRLQDPAVSAEAQLRLARAVLELDALYEVAVRAQMKALADLNDNAAALRVYHGFYERIELELAVEPSVETQELAIRIKLQTPAEDAVLASATPAPGSARPLTLVAVLPFERLGAPDIPDYMILGMLDQITCVMAAYRSPAVISSNSTRQFLGQAINPTEVGRQLDARYVVTGSISGSGAAQVLSVQLCDGANGRVYWAKNLTLSRSEALTQSLALAQDIARAIEPSLNLAELDRARAIPPDALEPHHLVLQAKDLMFRLSPVDFARARGLLDQALGTGASFAPAFALSAEWYAINLWQGWSRQSRDDSERLIDHARRALQHSPGDGRAMAQWGHYKIALERDFDGALALMDEAQQMAPSDSETLIWTVPTLAHSGQATRALQNGTEALRLSPFDPFQFRNEHFVSLAHYANHDHEAAARLGLACFSKAPNYGSNLRVTIAALQAAGRTAEAADLAIHHGQVEPRYSLNRVRDRMGFRDAETQDVYVSRLLAAGIAA
ncbi:BTAD domain-containing putative transcriptional regulator [Mesobacterium sp. TK19101]|uniref:BTAD domain-containing putative transcriptional regulator n=1 Tax=Mesobacterium hydrothermale TaxID=3111907 RepID=A0ABU6HNY0_9RHOB|nr:BTAD domain-containing putative transcriptional regulator [Mesobacterium sp. TK19101]MEC3863153.1 BTAD domain-containing putative transcriptional regulator [Mesobacterium sp. TK19101]